MELYREGMKIAFIYSYSHSDDMEYWVTVAQFWKIVKLISNNFFLAEK